MNLLEAAWVVARRDFVATVWSRSFILFLIVPLVMFAAAMAMTQLVEKAQRSSFQPVVAVLADGATVEALARARQRLARAFPDESLPAFRSIAPAEHIAIQAGRLLADEEGGYSAVLSGTLERPILTGPVKIEDKVIAGIEVILEDARRVAALDVAGTRPNAVPLERVATPAAAGNLQMIRHGLARGVMTAIFGIMILLSTLMLSNLAEEKSNKVIEVLAAAIPIDAVFYGKLIAMLGISLVGITVWGGTLAGAYIFVQLVQDWVILPQADPAVGWPAFFVLTILYYITTFMLLGAVSLCIGAQANNIRDIQTLTLPVSMLPVTIFMLAMMVVGREFDLLAAVAYGLPFSSPLAMIGFAAQHDMLWPHLMALAWQAFWVVVIVHLSSRLFKTTVFKSSPDTSLLGSVLGRRRRTS